MTNPINATTQESGRFYTHPSSGEKFWSVSTIAKALSKPALVPWAAKACAEYAVREWNYLTQLKDADRIVAIKGEHSRITGRSSAKGSQIHSIIEDWIKKGCPADYDITTCPRDPSLVKWNESGNSIITRGELEPYFQGFRDWTLKHEPRFIHAETTVWSRKEKYAGTLDLIAHLPHFAGGVTAILDAKSGNNVYPEVGLQLAAYARAEFYLDNGVETPLPECKAAFVLHVQSGVTRMIPVSIEDEVYHSFLYIREAFRFMEVISKNVLGAEVK